MCLQINCILNSMGKIHELDQDLINKIAAGEVIERPASVVKELVENSIDANAKNIIIEVKEGGKSFIRITDDGSGMSKEDLIESIKKHTTSKIKTKEDLFNILTLGFRGEALSSIASISMLEIISKTITDIEGSKLEINNGIVNVKPTGAPVGTTIKVQDLFYNTPARKKHLKDMQVEFRYIADVVEKYALLHPNIGIRLVHNGKDVILAPPTNDALGNIINIYGLDLGKQLIPINKQLFHLKMEGFIGKPALNRGDKSFIITYVNGRLVKNKILSDAIFDAFHNLLNTERFPVAILNFQIPNNKLDVNVHPTKIEIRIEREKDIYQEIMKTIEEVLQENALVPKIDLKQMQQTQLKKEPHMISTDINSIIANTKSIMEENARELMNDDKFKYRPIDKEQTDQNILTFDKGELKIIPIKDVQTPFKILGKVHKTFIVVETAEGMRIIDLHAAHERINYEVLMKKYKENQIKKQELIQPIKIDVSIEEAELLKENKRDLEVLGITLDEFGKNSFLIRTLPSILGKQQDSQIIFDLMEDCRKNYFNTVNAKMEHWIHTMACRMSKKAGDQLEFLEQSYIVSELLRCKQPHTCPHGRPTMIDLSLRDFEKFFNRVRGYENKGCSW